ncbi:MAG: lysylphosphatidylglycerol synthase transmembrane domain-containing protein [Clostridia bacterium]
MEKKNTSINRITVSKNENTDTQNANREQNSITGNKCNSSCNDDNFPVNKNINEEIIINKKDKRKKEFTTYLLFILANLLVILIILLLEDNNGQKISWDKISPILRQNWYYIAFAFGTFLLLLIGDTITFYLLTKKMGVTKPFLVSLKTSIYGRYYDKITPWAMGGEPFQIGFLTKSGLGIDKSSAITMSRHLIKYFVTAIAVILIFSISGISAGNITVMVVACLSVLAGLIVPVFMVICCISPKIGLNIAKNILKFLHKIKIVKNYDKTLEKVNKDVASFLEGIGYLSANKTIFIVIGFFALVELFGINGVPFFVIRGLQIDASYWHILVLCLFVNYAASFSPTPGGAGIAELSFYAIFASYLTDGYIFWAVIIWRLAVFYVPVILGFLLVVYDGIKGLIKNNIFKQKI